jgi:hypothetical protein
MRKITLDADLRAKLGELTGEIALCDESGQPLAYVVEPQFREMLYDLVADMFDDHAVEAARQDYAKNGGGKTFEQVMARLKSLEQPEKQSA